MVCDAIILDIAAKETQRCCEPNSLNLLLPLLLKARALLHDRAIMLIMAMMKADVLFLRIHKREGWRTENSTDRKLKLTDFEIGIGWTVVDLLS